jgi:hypothetical protein
MSSGSCSFLHPSECVVPAGHSLLFAVGAGPPHDGVSQVASRRGILDAAPELGSFADTAALIQHLDLVISVDTSVAHLAGALGKSVWVLLPYVSDYRWFLDRDDSPWYPTARLFRQTATRDYADVVDRVRADLLREKDEHERRRIINAVGPAGLEPATRPL